MKIVDLLNAAPVMQQLIDRKMPAQLAYALAKNFRMITQELVDYDKARLSLLAAHWALDQKTGKYDIPDEDQEKWRKMHDELIQGETGYQPYKVDFSLCENIELTPGEILALSFIFEHLDLGRADLPVAPYKPDNRESPDK
jgi:hypothetical protein